MFADIIIAAIVLAVAASFVYNFKRSQKLKREGIEVKAIVSRVREIENVAIRIENYILSQRALTDAA